MKVSELKKLSHRNWNEIKVYDSICVINSGYKHDSGYAVMYIIGMISGTFIEIAASCDDICWSFPNHMRKGDLQNDMFYQSGVLHYHSNRYNFEVGHSLSSVDIKLIQIPCKSYPSNKAQSR